MSATEKKSSPKKRVLVVSFSQTGQLREIVRRRYPATCTRSPAIRIPLSTW